MTKVMCGKWVKCVVAGLVLSASAGLAKADTLLSGTAIAYFNFSENPDGSGSTDAAFSLLVTSSTLFASAPTISINTSVSGSKAIPYTALSTTLVTGTPGTFGLGGLSASGSNPVASLNPVTGETMQPGTALRWAGSSGNSGAGNPYASFTLTLNTTGLEGIRVSMDYRATSLNSNTRYLGLEYKVGDDDWVVLSYPSWGAYSPSDSNYADNSKTLGIKYLTDGKWYQGANGFNFDFSAYDVLNNQSSVQLRFTSNILNLDSDNNRTKDSFMVDNLAVYGTVMIPEPSSYVLLGLGLAGLTVLMLKRRRMANVR